MQHSFARNLFRSAGFAIAATLASLSPAMVAQAAGIEVAEVEFSDSAQGDAMQIFHPDTAEIHMHAGIHGAPSGTKVTATWIADKTDRAPPGTKIRDSDVTLGTIDNFADFSISKPTTELGWPIGTYRVDITIDGKVVKSGHFEVDK